MGQRTHPDNFLWVFLCCGGLPILGFIKGLIIVGPIFIISLIGFTGIAIILLPHDIFLTYKAICKTSIIGINLKILTMLLLPIALISWPFLVAFVGSIVGIFYGLFCPTVRTFDSNYHLIFGGFVDVFQDIFKFINNFWHFNYDSYFTFLHEIEYRKEDEPFDINILQIIIALILAGYGSAVGVIIGSLMWIIKLIPSIYRLYYYLFKEYCNLRDLRMLMYFILFLIAFALIPVLGVLAILIYICFGLYGGIFCAIEGYKHHIGRGIISIWNTIYDMDKISNDMIFEINSSFLPNCKDKCLKKDKPKRDNQEVDKQLDLNENDSSKVNLFGNEENKDNTNLNKVDNKINANLDEERKKEINLKIEEKKNVNLNDEEKQENTNLN